jgi:hypothetical protein
MSSSMSISADEDIIQRLIQSDSENILESIELFADIDVSDWVRPAEPGELSENENGAI